MKHKSALILTRFDNFTGDCTEKFNMGDFNIASLKLQVKPLTSALTKSGFNYKIISLSTSEPESLDLVGSPDMVIVSKLNTHKRNQNNMAMSNLAALARIKCKNIPIATIYSDNLADVKKFPTGEFHRNLLSMTDTIICPSNKLAQLAKKHNADAKLFIIKDPWQIRYEIPFKQISSSSNIHLIWFGQASNIQFLHRIIPEITQIKSDSNDLILTILSEARAIEFTRKMFENYALPKGWNFRYIPWDVDDQPNQLEKELAQSHISLIPSDPSMERKAGVSHNRIIDSLRSGCIPIASPMASYIELKDLAVVTNNFREALTFALNNYNFIASKLQSQRTEALAEFSPEKNFKEWEKVVSYFSNSMIN